MAVGQGAPTCSLQLAGKWFPHCRYEQGLHPREKPAARFAFQEELQGQYVQLGGSKCHERTSDHETR